MKMKMKLLQLAVAAGLALMTTLTMAEQPENKGVITTLDVQRGLISINTKDMFIGSATHVQTAKGKSKHLRNLKIRQHVRYSANEDNMLTEIWIYPADSQQLRQLGYDEEIGND